MWCRNHFAVLMFTLCSNSGDEVGHDNGDGDEDDDSDDADHTCKVGVVFGEDVTMAMTANRVKMMMDVGLVHFLEPCPPATKQLLRW